MDFRALLYFRIARLMSNAKNFALPSTSVSVHFEPLHKNNTNNTRETSIAEDRAVFLFIYLYIFLTSPGNAVNK